MALTNWAGNITFSTSTLHRPAGVEELQELVAGTPRLRVLGTGHSFSPVADSADALVTVAELPKRLEIDADAGAVTVSAATRFGELTQVLEANGWALHNLGSLPHISVGGAVSTGTHGSGRTNQTLAGAVRGLELVAPDGTLERLARGDRHFDGSVVALGALGVVTALTLDIQPRYDVEQRVYENMPLETLRENLLDVLSAAYSVSAFLTWNRPLAEQVWVKHRVDAGPWPEGEDWLGAQLADGPRNPVPGMEPGFTTEQGGVAGPWNARLPHFRLEFTPSSGDELQSEYLLPLANAVPALDVLAGLAAKLGPLLHVSEVRTVAADDYWLSGSYRQDSIALHFTWYQRPDAVEPVLRELEAGLAPLGARPHWGKVFYTEPAEVAALYPRFADARALFEAADPTGKFRNPFVDRYLFP